MALSTVRSMGLPVFMRKAHRIIATSWLVFFGLTLALQAVGTQSLLVTVPLVVTLVFLIITGSYMLVKPWVRRFRGA